MQFFVLIQNHYFFLWRLGSLPEVRDDAGSFGGIVGHKGYMDTVVCNYMTHKKFEFTIQKITLNAR